MISAVRHKPDKEDSESDELDSDEYEVAPWPTGVVERYPTPTLGSHTNIWENRGGKSRVIGTIPREPREEGGYAGRKKELFVDNPLGIPEMPADLSSDEEDFMAKNFPNYVRPPSRSRSPVSPCSPPGSARHISSASTPMSSSYRLRSVSDASFGDLYGRPSTRTLNYEPSHHPYQFIPRHKLESGYNPYSQETASQPRYRAENPPWHRNQTRQPFNDNDDDAVYESMTQYLTTPISTETSAHVHDISAKARGKQRQMDEPNEHRVPSRQMSQLRLETHSSGHYVGRPSSVIDMDYGEDFSPTSPMDDHATGSRRHRESRSGGLKRRATTSSTTDTSRKTRGAGRSRPSSTVMVDSESEEDREWDPKDEYGGASSVKSMTSKKRKVNRYPCPVPHCTETFTRRNDVRRHVRNAAIHRDQPEALAILGEVAGDTGTRCKYCGTDLSRSDARMRHERASACGKRTTQKMKESVGIRT